MWKGNFSKIKWNYILESSKIFIVDNYKMSNESYSFQRMGRPSNRTNRIFAALENLRQQNIMINRYQIDEY